MSSADKPVRLSPVPRDIEIAQAATMKPITEIAAKAGILEEELELYGRYKAKIDYMALLKRLKDVPDGKIIDVTAITPTPLGEGKTVTSVGLSESMNAIGIKTMLALREPSLGPVFGIKGGAAGGGYSQLIPMEDLNLHFTGDIHAVGTANNLLAAMIDSHLMHGNELDIDPLTISWRRVVDLNDRAMREIVNGLGGRLNGVPRQTGYDITVASEVMAILGLATSLKDLRERLGRITFGYNKSGNPLTAVPGSQPAGHSAEHSAQPFAAGRRVGRWLSRGRAQLGQGVFDHRPQRLRFKGAGAQISRDGQSGLGGALVQLRALRLAHADGNAGPFQIPFKLRGLQAAGLRLWIFRRMKHRLRNSRELLRRKIHKAGWLGIRGLRARLGKIGGRGRAVAGVGAQGAFVAEGGDVFGQLVIVPGGGGVSLRWR